MAAVYLLHASIPMMPTSCLKKAPVYLSYFANITHDIHVSMFYMYILHQATIEVLIVRLDVFIFS